MAQVLKLARTGSSDISLVSASGWFLTDPGWVPKIGDEFGSPLEEVLQIQSNFTSQDNLAAAVVALNKVRTYAVRSLSDRQEEIVWFHDKLNSETGERRAAARAIALKQLAEEHGTGGADTGSMISADAAYELGIQRMPYWEPTSARNMPYLGAAGSPAAAVVYDYTAAGAAVTAHDIVGDVPARIAGFTITPNSNLGKVWIGIRSARKHGATGLSNFAPVWEIENGSNGTDANDQADGDASGDAVVRVTPGTATWALRATVYLNDVSANEADNFGTYLWLLRCWETAAGSWEVQCRFGYGPMDSDEMVRGPKRIVDWGTTSAAGQYIEVGVASIPMRDLQGITTTLISADEENVWCIEIWARRLTGASSLDLDCLCPVPIDEGWLKVWDMDLAGGASNEYFYYAESPLGRVSVCTDESGMSRFPPFVAHQFRLPPGDGRMIIVPQVHDGGNIDSIKVNAGAGAGSSDDGRYCERWLSLRGAE